MPWHWEKEQQNVFEELKARMAMQPVLRQPDFTKQFYITTNASAYGVGAILLQEGEFDPLRPKSSSKLHPIVYYSATFTPTEWNYDIHDRELLAIYKAIKHWQAYLIWTKTPFEVQTDHANLLFWKSPQKLNRWTARWHSELQDYNFTPKHIAGKSNAAADALSRPPGVEQGKKDNQEITMLDPKMFIRLLQLGDPGTMESLIVEAQNQLASVMDGWDPKKPLQKTTLDDEISVWTHPSTNKLVIPLDQKLYQRILQG